MFRDGPIRRFLGQAFDNTDLEALREAKRTEWRAKGYSEDLINMALDLADKWSKSMASTWSPPGRTDIYDAILKNSYPKALENATTWIEKMSI